MEIRSAAVIGAGTMGQGIAQMTALAGIPVLLLDIDEDALHHALNIIQQNLNKGIEKDKVTPAQRDLCLKNISTSSRLTDLKADVLIEAIVEDISVKRQLFNDLEEMNAASAIIASNTSSIPITQLAAGMKHPQRFVGMHFFNPAHIMPLVEVIRGTSTSDETVETIIQLAVTMGKSPVTAKDSPGFIVNRVARHFYVEALAILEEGVADVEVIDELLRSAGFKLGPFELMDLIGVDTNFAVTSRMYEAFHYDPRFRPSRIQQQKVDAGHHGRKSGHGFYSYE